MLLVEKIEISGGFLPALSVNIPRGLTCIIGPRGSGKSTLAEALRFAVREGRDSREADILSRACFKNTSGA